MSGTAMDFNGEHDRQPQSCPPNTIPEQVVKHLRKCPSARVSLPPELMKLANNYRNIDKSIQ